MLFVSAAGSTASASMVEGKSDMMASRFVLVGLWLVLFMPLVTWGNSLPQSIGPLALTKLQSGEEARKEIDRLHGKPLGYREGYIGSYADEKGKAKLWVSEYGSLEEAAKATAKMVQGMKGGEQKNFWHFREIPMEGVPVYFVVGMGQAHYFFQKGVKVLWLAVDPPLAKQAIRDLLGGMP